MYKNIFCDDVKGGVFSGVNKRHGYLNFPLALNLPALIVNRKTRREKGKGKHQVIMEECK